jgi:hypothetical protein
MPDPLADALRPVRLAGYLFLYAHFAPPRRLTSGAASREYRPFFADPVQIGCDFAREGRLLESLAAIHVMAAGRSRSRGCRANGLSRK